MAEAGAAPQHTVMIGDTAYDMDMARSAGVRAIGVGWGYHAPEELYAGGADEVADDPEAIWKNCCDDPKRSSRARNRFLIIGCVRVAGVAMVLIGA